MNKFIQKILFFLKEYKHGVVALLLAAIVSDMVFIKLKSDVITLAILGLILLCFRLYKYTPKRIFAICFFPVVVIFFGFMIDPTSVAIEKAAVWLFLLMAAGIVQELFQTGAQ